MFITLSYDLDLWPCDLDVSPLTLNICSVLPVTWWNSVTILNAIEQFAAELLRFQCLTLWPCCSRIWVIFTKFDLRQLIYGWIIAFFWCWYVMSHCDLDFWPVDLESSRYIQRHVINACTKFERNRAFHGWIIDNFANFAHVMPRCDHDLWPPELKLLQHFGCYAFKLCTKFERNRIIHRWVIDDFDGAWTQLHQTWRGHRTIIPTREMCFIVRISCCIFQTRAAQSWVMLKRRQISHFLTPPPVKIRERIGEISIPIVEALPTTEPPKYIWWPSTARLLSAVYWYLH